MAYTEDFKHILAKRNQINNANLFVFKNNTPRSMKVFPEEVSNVLLEKYFDTLTGITEENEFVDFIPTTVERGTLQVIGIDILTLWPSMLSARNEIQNIDRAEITVDDYRCDGNTILMDVEFDDGEHVFLLTVYRNVASWYSNNVRFTKRDAKFHEEKGEILALTPWVDAVISDQRCYIINEQNFNKIFKFDEVIKNQVAASEPEIRSMDFIGDSDAFMMLLGKSVRQKNAMAKVIMQRRIEKIKKFSPKYIREQIEHQPELSFISYTPDDKIIIDEKSFKAVVGILCGSGILIHAQHPRIREQLCQLFLSFLGAEAPVLQLAAASRADRGRRVHLAAAVVAQQLVG